MAKPFMGQPGHIVLAIFKCKLVTVEFRLCVVSFRGRPSGGLGGKLFGESENLGIRLQTLTLAGCDSSSYASFLPLWREGPDSCSSCFLGDGTEE